MTAQAFHRPVHSREHHRRGALNVVVEAQRVAAIPLENRIRVLGLEIFKLNQRVRPAVAHAANKLLDEVVVLLALQTRVLTSEIIRVVQQIRVVRAHVQDDREHVLGIESTTRDV